MAFIIKYGLSFSAAEEIDDLLIEWKNTSFPSKSEFEAALAGIELRIPHTRGHLTWAKSVSSAWTVCHTPRHTVPLTEGPACFLACHMAARGHARIGAGLIVQEALGLRPSELLALTDTDLMLPEDRAQAFHMPALLALGTKAGTKAKRQQSVVLSAPKKVALLRWLRANTASGEKLIGYSYDAYRKLLDRVATENGLGDVGYTPHSPRSGFASDCIAAGFGYTRTRELGRWASETSLRTYVDIVSASSIQVNLKTMHLNAAVSYCCLNLLKFFVGSEEFHYPLPAGSASCSSAATDAASRLAEDGGRLVSTSASLVDGVKGVSLEEAPERHADEDCSSATPQRGRGGAAGRRVRFASDEPTGQDPGRNARGSGRGRR